MQDSLTFKMKYSPLIVCISIGATLFFTGLIIFEDGMSLNLKAYSVAIFAAVVFSIFYAFIIVHFYKTTLTKEGIKNCNFWGKYHFLTWNEITVVKPINFFGLRYLRVFSSSLTLSLWIPLFLQDMEKFTESVGSLAPDGNVLRNYYSK